MHIEVKKVGSELYIVLYQHVNVVVDAAWEKQTRDQIYSKWKIKSIDLPEAQQDNALKLHYFLSSCEILRPCRAKWQQT